MTTPWPDSIDEIIGGDDVVMLAYATPANGVVLTPVTNFAMRDRAAGTFTVNSSVGAPKKLARMRSNPNVAIAFHSRAHARHERPEYVLLQGRATLSDPIPDYPSAFLEDWERVEPWRDVSGWRKRWLRVYATRVSIEIAVERLVVWPDLACTGKSDAVGARLPGGDPGPQRPPGRGTGPRVDPTRTAARARSLPHVLLGWIGADGLPFVVPVKPEGVEAGTIALDAPSGLVPSGGRRAGLTAHRFARHAIGQHQRVHTGWLEADSASDRVRYAPHTSASYRFPASELVFHLVAGGGTRWRYRCAQRATAAT